ncbi:hypothetical protein, partial [Stenotrophomonas maltophilia]|uniref:hypothetical protein n=1 Tax=Stenotrophomonas maltophilia TaxID=40324 RepID=UPI0039C090BF
DAHATTLPFPVDAGAGGGAPVACLGNIVQPCASVKEQRGNGRSHVGFNQDALGADVPRNRYEMQADA